MLGTHAIGSAGALSAAERGRASHLWATNRRTGFLLGGRYFREFIWCAEGRYLCAGVMGLSFLGHCGWRNGTRLESARDGPHFERGRCYGSVMSSASYDRCPKNGDDLQRFRLFRAAAVSLNANPYLFFFCFLRGRLWLAGTTAVGYVKMGKWTAGGATSTARVRLHEMYSFDNSRRLTVGACDQS